MIKQKVRVKSFKINDITVTGRSDQTLLEVAKVFELCKKKGVKTIISHRSGETMDSALADYAIAFQADYIKCGISTQWREVKLSRLVEIERQINYARF